MLRGTDLDACAESLPHKDKLPIVQPRGRIRLCRDRRDLPAQIRASCVIERPPSSMAGVSSRSSHREPAEEAPRGWSDRDFLLRRWPRRAWGT